MKKVSILLSVFLLVGCGATELSTAEFGDLCEQSGGTVEIAGDEVYCFVDDEKVEYCTYSEYLAEECVLD
ncbi:hypothetical protein HOE67_04780 [Candidatus Peregrinibacteria bacterium]|jgi:hypothetical protein|nr:hypothetical protein [Candidatus Peregrinibacteria bacterium]MBT4056395.1 hypothetical protein [Candidatus Peregrinibacteria bacterium]